LKKKLMSRPSYDIDWFLVLIVFLGVFYFVLKAF
jgi:hypothetical protein